MNDLLLHWRAASVDVLSEKQKHSALCKAFKSLSCTTQIMTNPISKKLRRLMQFYYPLPPFIHILQQIKRDPFSEHAAKAWAIISENYRTSFPAFVMSEHDRSLYKAFVKPILTTWDVCEAAARGAGGEPPAPPEIVVHDRQQLASMEQEE